MVNADNPRYASVFPPPVGTHIRSTMSLYSDFGFSTEEIHINI